MTDTSEHVEEVESAPENQPIGVEPGPGGDDAEIAMLRELVYKAHPDVVRELLRGETLTDLLASVEPARAAYQRIAERVQQGLNHDVRQGTLPEVRPDVAPGPDPAMLTTAQRLRLGLRQRGGTSS